MRAVVGRDYRYIWNGWHDGKTSFRNESLSGLSWEAMTAAAKSDPVLAKRVAFYSHRVPHEFYHTKSDPDSLNNLIDQAEHSPRINELQKLLHKHMKDTGDPQLKNL